VDWSTVVQALPSLLVGDGVHATGEGYSARASLIAEAVQACGAGGATGTGVGGIPAPRNPRAAPPPRLGTPAVLSAPPALGFVLSRAGALIAEAAQAARTAASKAGREPVLGAP